MGAPGDARLDAENRALVAQLCAARPRLLGLKPAAEVIPGLAANLVLHAGPPIAWRDMTPAMRAGWPPT